MWNRDTEVGVVVVAEREDLVSVDAGDEAAEGVDQGLSPMPQGGCHLERGTEPQVNERERFANRARSKLRAKYLSAHGTGGSGTFPPGANIPGVRRLEGASQRLVRRRRKAPADTRSTSVVEQTWHSERWPERLAPAAGPSRSRHSTTDARLV